jgi:hypothetical protein
MPSNSPVAASCKPKFGTSAFTPTRSTPLSLIA